MLINYGDEINGGYMDFEIVSKLILDSFKKSNVRFALIGGFALHVSGITRATKDIDFLVNKEDMPKVKKLMKEFGYDLIHESEDVSNFWGNLSSLGAIDFLHAHRSYALAMLERAKMKDILNGQFSVKVVIPEDLIGLKVQAIANDIKRYQQDMVDIQSILEVHYKKLDMTLIEEYFNLFGKKDELERILQELN